MATTRIGTLKPVDRQAVFETAQKLGLDPYEFGALIHQESGFRPNVWGGSGGKYRGLIQFGPGARKEVGLPSKEMTISEQLPYVKKYFEGRGYKPGMGIAKAYATVLGGNPNVSLKAKDSFGTSVESSLPKFKPGGSLYKAAKATLGDFSQTQQTKPPEQQQQQQTIAAQTPGGITYNIYVDEFDQPMQRDPMDFLQKIIQKPEGQRYSPAEVATALTSAIANTPNYDFGLNPWRQ